VGEWEKLEGGGLRCVELGEKVCSFFLTEATQTVSSASLVCQ
jgi:hypothetical protein